LLFFLTVLNSIPFNVFKYLSWLTKQIYVTIIRNLTHIRCNFISEVRFFNEIAFPIHLAFFKEKVR